MKFYLNEQHLNLSPMILHNDDSFQAINNVVSWDFQISIQSFPVLLLNFNYEMKACTGIEGALIIPKRCISKRINIKVIKKGILKVDEFPTSQDACGISYNLPDKNIFYDENKMILGGGNVTDLNEVFEIGIGQYVKLENRQITAIFVKLH